MLSGYNLSIIAPLFAAVSLDELSAYFKDKKTAKLITFDDFCLWATKTRKNAWCYPPHTTALLTHSDAYAVKRPLKPAQHQSVMGIFLAAATLIRKTL